MLLGVFSEEKNGDLLSLFIVLTGHALPALHGITTRHMLLWEYKCKGNP